VSDRPLPNPTRSRQAAKRFRRRGRRLAHRFLDEAYAEYLRDLAPQNDNKQTNKSNISVPSPPPQLPSPSSNQVLSHPRFPTPPLGRTRFPSFRINIQDIPRFSFPFYSFLLSLLLLFNLLSRRATSLNLPREFPDFKSGVH